MIKVAMNILLTNDDGIYAEGLWALYQQFAGKHRVTVVAPDRERSAISHAITLHEPLRVHRVSLNGWQGFAVNGTPADCIKLGLLEIVETKPDVVISGINPGANVGTNINHSGTVAAAKEAALYGYKAMAVSIRKSNHPSNYQTAAYYAEKLADYIFDKGLPFGTILNVNVPDAPIEQIAGIRITRQNIRTISDYFEKRVDPRNRDYYWQGEDVQQYGDELDIDRNALAQKYVSVTPLKCDMTDYHLLESLKAADFKDCSHSLSDH